MSSFRVVEKLKALKLKLKNWKKRNFQENREEKDSSLVEGGFLGYLGSSTSLNPR